MARGRDRPLGGREDEVNWLYVVSALVALALLIYLLVALLKPEELG